MKLVKFAKYFSLLLALSACGGDYKDPVINGEEAVFGSQKVQVVNGNLTVSNTTIQGTGSLVFDSRYDEFKSRGSYALDFTMEDGGSVTLVSHSSQELTGGYEVEYRREGATLKVTLRAQGKTWSAVTNFNGIDAANQLKFQIDVHNNEDGQAHVIVWNRLLGDNFTIPSAVLNTAEEIDGSPGLGNGVRWGLILNKATVTRADRMGPKFIH